MFLCALNSLLTNFAFSVPDKERFHMFQNFRQLLVLVKRFLEKMFIFQVETLDRNVRLQLCALLMR